MNLSIKNTIAFVAIALLIAACTKTPQSCFTVDKGKTAHVNEEVQFDANCSKDADTYDWNYGDGSTNSGVTTKHKYTATGTYIITLTAHHSSKSANITQTIAIQ